LNGITNHEKISYQVVQSSNEREFQMPETCEIPINKFKRIHPNTLLINLTNLPKSNRHLPIDVMDGDSRTQFIFSNAEYGTRIGDGLARLIYKSKDEKILIVHNNKNKMR